jgi:hypothetical protein
VQEPRPYDRVITKDAKSDSGVFTVHRIRERYYEILKKELGKEFCGQLIARPRSARAGAVGGQRSRRNVVNNRVL